MLVLEALAAALLGMVALWLVLRPLLRPVGARPAPVYEPPELEETAKGVALAALKEIEFDRETGKLSDADYELLKSKYTAAALEALRLEASRQEEVGDGEATGSAHLRTLRSAPASTPPTAASCPTCGPRPEPDAVFCSTCGRRLHRRVAA